MIGSTLGPYEVQALLGEGGMGEVYRAHDTKLGRDVALKVLHSRVSGSPEARSRLIREARSLAAVHHPGIATLFGLESFDGHDLLVMELVDGRPLSAFLREGVVDLEMARSILAQACEALAAAHAHGIVHRDLKPDNLMLTPDNRLKILDFGLAIGNDDTQITREGSTLGTIAYMSPEQARGEAVDARSDLFSLGVIAWEMLTGERLFKSDNAVALLHRISGLHQVPRLARGRELPDDLVEFVEGCLNPDVAERVASADELLALIAPDSVSSSGVSVRRASPGRRWRILVPVALGVVVALVIFGSGVWNTSIPEGPSAVQEGALAVLPFNNLSPTEDLDWFAVAVAELLATTMANSPMVDVISPERVRLILESAADGPVDGLGLMANSNIGYSITGSVLGTGAAIRVESRLVDNQAGTVLHSVVGQADSPDDLYVLVEDLDRRYREFIEVRAISERIQEEWTQELATYSVEAYRAYARGREQLSAAQWGPAITFFTEAVSIDSTFVSAWVDLSSCYWNTSDMAAMAEAFDRAMDLRDRASPRERLWLDLFGAVKEGEGPQIILYAEELLEQEPEHRFVRYLLGKGHYENADWDLAVEAWKPLRAERWSWIWTYLYSSRALSSLGDADGARVALDELDEVAAPNDEFARTRLHRYRGLVELEAGKATPALAEFGRVLAMSPDFVEAHFDLARAHLLAGSEAEARSELEQYLANPGGELFVVEARELLAGLD
jgi:serine/threonine protein kinase/tetratricopeptide (TPR) repeat protein